MLALLTQACASTVQVSVNEYSSQLVGIWKEVGKHPDRYEFFNDGTLLLHHNHAGGCLVFEPERGVWRLKDQQLALEMVSEYDYQALHNTTVIEAEIVSLSDKNMTLTYVASGRSQKFKRVR